MLKNFKNLIYLIFILNISLYSAPQNCNLFEPYDWLFDQVRFNLFPENDDYGLTIGLRYEGSVNTNGYLSDDINTALNPNKSCFGKKVNPVKFLEERENAFAAFLGNIPDTNFNTFSQQYFPYEGMTANDQVDFCGNFRMGSVVANIEKWLTETIRVGWYLPYYYLNLNQISTTNKNEKILYEEFIEDNILNIYKKYNNSIKPYNLYGFGDSTLLISWQDNFFEKRDFLTGVLCSLRAGFNLPTGQKKDYSENTLLKIPLGYDAAWGLAFGGTLEIDIGCYFGAGISADLISFFGKTCCRYIKTDRSQTDLMLLNNSLCYIDPGFRETFTILFNCHDLKKTYMGTIAYQYNKQNENDIIVCSETFPTLVAMTSERLGAWTAHNLTLLLQGVFEISGYTSTIGIFGKLGFNGERLISANTLGINLEIIY